MKILLVEDDLHTRELITATLLEQRYVVDAIADGMMGLEMALQWDYDLILLDLLLPGLNGLDICRRLRSQECSTPILMLTAKTAVEDIVAGLDAGADDYLVKSCDSAQLLARVRALLRRHPTSNPTPILAWGSLELDPVSARVTYHSQAIALRPKEYALLELFLRYPQRIFSRSGIIDHLWSAEDTPVEGVITNLIKDLRQRLKAAGMQENLIETVYGLGYRLQALPPAQPPLPCPNQLPPSLTSDQTATITLERDLQQLLGRIRIQQITERYQAALTDRIENLEAAQRSLVAGQLSLAERQAACDAAHKLAGGLGTFGSGQAATIAREIEALLAENLRQEALLTTQLTQLVEALKQSVAQVPASR